MRNFKLAQPGTLEQAAALLADDPIGRRLMAGGTDLVDEIKSGTVSPEVVVDLSLVPGLSGIREDGSAFLVGAMTPVADLAENEALVTVFPGLAQAALSLATPQIRNVGTVGGNLCQRPRCWYYRDPLIVCRKKGGSRCFAFNGRNKYHAVIGGTFCYIVFPSDLAPMLIALDAEAVITGPKGERKLALEEFYVLPGEDVTRENALAAGEILKEVRIPRSAGQGKVSAYRKLKERGTWDFAVVSAAVSVDRKGGLLKNPRIVLGGIAPVPWRLRDVEERIQGRKFDRDLVKQAVSSALREARPLRENGYKLTLAAAAAADALESVV